MTWPFLLLLAAAGLSTAAALAARSARRDEPAEAGARRAIVGLGLLVVAAASAAVGGALLGAGDTGQGQAVVFAGAATTVALPLLVVGLTRSGRRHAPPVRSGARRDPRSSGSSGIG